MKILVVAAHADDEVLGAGGTIARHVQEGSECRVLFLTDGVGSRSNKDEQASKRRKEAADRALDVLGAKRIACCDFPDNALDSVPLLDIVKAVEKHKQDFKADLIYTHHGGDLNIDHRIACQAVLTAFRPQPEEGFREVRAFETVSSTEWAHRSVGVPFEPDTFIDISSTLERKLESYREYQEEMRMWPHPRSEEAIRHLVAWRGASVGVSAAEAFSTLLRICR